MSSAENPIIIPDHLRDVENLTVLPVNAEPRYEIELIRETNYGDKYDDVVYLGFINDFAVDNNGRVYLADMSNAVIQVYNPDGTYLTQIGREGRGPGEFQTMRGGLDIGVNDDYLITYDDTNFRVSRFSLETLELVDIVNLDPLNWAHIDEKISTRPFRVYPGQDGNYLVRFRTRPNTIEPGQQFVVFTADNNISEVYYTFNQEMEPVTDKIFEHDTRRSHFTEIDGQPSIFSFSFAVQDLFAISEAGSFYSASSEEFLVEIFDSTGAYSRSIYHDLPLVPFTNEDKTAFEEERNIYRRVFREIDLPEYWPALNLILADDENRLWISTVTESNDSFEWWVLDGSGELLGKFQWPGNRMEKRGGEDYENYIIRNGSLYHFTSESMSLDDQTVIKYRIDMTPIQGR